MYRYDTVQIRCIEAQRQEIWSSDNLEFNIFIRCIGVIQEKPSISFYLNGRILKSTRFSSRQIPPIKSCCFGAAFANFAKVKRVRWYPSTLWLTVCVMNFRLMKQGETNNRLIIQIFVVVMYCNLNVGLAKDNKISVERWNTVESRWRDGCLKKGLKSNFKLKFYILYQHQNSYFIKSIKTTKVSRRDFLLFFFTSFIVLEKII